MVKIKGLLIRDPSAVIELFKLFVFHHAKNIAHLVVAQMKRTGRFIE